MSVSEVNGIAEAIHELRNGFDQQRRDLADLRGRTSNLSKEIEELKKWAASLPKGPDSDFSYTQKPI
jgi:chromosome segregation ATPase